MSEPSMDNERHEYNLWLDAVKSGGTTPPLVEYRRWSEFDPNLFWHLSCGDHQNLLDEAIDALDAPRPAIDVEYVSSATIASSERMVAQAVDDGGLVPVFEDDRPTTSEERVEQAARGIQDNIDAWGRGEANASVEDQARAALTAAGVDELESKVKRLQVDLTQTQVALNNAEREREQSRSERSGAVDLLSESRAESRDLAATVARVEAVHDEYFDMDGEPGLDDTTPEPEDVWRYDRALRAALHPKKESDR